MFDELRHFLLIVQHGTFTEAARRAHLTQPALSASIRRLEEQLGARLLDRGSGGTVPNAAGRVLIPRARAALAAVEDGRRAVAEISGLHAGEVRLGAGATACTYLLPPILARYREAHPGVVYRLRELETERVRNSIAAGHLDLGIITLSGLRSYDLVVEPWRRDELILVCAPDAPCEGPLPPFVTFPEGSPARELMAERFPEATIVMELGGIAAIKGNVRAGIGVALVSRAAVAHDLEQGRLAEWRDSRVPFERVLALIHRGEDRLPPAAGALREMLLESATTPA